MGNYGRQRDAGLVRQLGRYRLANGKLKEELNPVVAAERRHKDPLQRRPPPLRSDPKTTNRRFPVVFYAGACKSPCRESVIF